MRFVDIILLVTISAVIVENVSSESASGQSSVESLAQEELFSNSPAPPSSNTVPKIRIPASTQPPEVKIKIPTTTSGPQQGTGVPTTSLLPKKEKAVTSTTTQRVPVYIPLKEKESRTTTQKPSAKISNTRKETEAARPSLSSTSKKDTNEKTSEKKTTEKRNDSTDLAERNDAVAENKEGFFSAINLPLAASIGAAIMFGGLAYFMQPEPEPISSRKGIPPHLGYDHGVRIVRPSDLTPAELDRLVKVGGYRVSGRSISESAHPYFDFAKQVYQYVMPEILGGSSKEEGGHERVYIIRHHHNQDSEDEELEKSLDDNEGTESPENTEKVAASLSTVDHPYNRILKKSLPKI